MIYFVDDKWFVQRRLRGKEHLVLGTDCNFLAASVLLLRHHL